MTTKGSNNPFPSILLNEVATDGSDTPTPVADYRRLFLGEDGALHLIDSSDVVTDVGGSSGDVATDTIWNAAGDLAVGTGSDTAARLAIGSAGGFLGVTDGALAYLAGTSFPGSPDADDLYYRTDRNKLYFYDGTQWVTVAISEMHFIGRGNVIPGVATFTYGDGCTRMGQGDIYVLDFRCASFVNGPNNATDGWDVTLDKRTYANAATTLATVNTRTTPDTASTWVDHTTAVNAVVVGSTHGTLRIIATRVASGGSIVLAATVTYREVG